MANYTTTVPSIPDPGFIIDRDEIVALVKAQDCISAKVIARATNYGELVDFLVEFINTFSCINMKVYLNSLMDCVTDAIKIANKIYHDDAALSNLVNPKIISKSSLAGIITINTEHPELIICNSSIVNRIEVVNFSTLDLLIISGGSTVNELYVEEGSKIKSLILQTCEGTNADTSILNKVISSTANIWRIDKGTGSTFGGFECITTTTITIV